MPVAGNGQERTGLLVRVTAQEREALRVVAITRGYQDGRGVGMARVLYEIGVREAVKEAARIKRELKALR